MKLPLFVIKLLKMFGKKHPYKHITIQAHKHEFPITPHPAPDVRDWKYAPTITNVAPPTNADLSGKFNPIRNQLSLGSCQSFALVSVLEYMWNRDRKEKLDFSEMYTYYAIRYWNGEADKNTGAYIIDTVKSPLINGYCFEENMPYNLDYKALPTMKARIAAGMLKLYMPKGYYKIDSNNIDMIKQALLEGVPIIFGMVVFNSFQTVGSEGIIPFPKIGEMELGGHAMVICGFDDIKAAFLIRNSWGTEWGNHGYAWLPYQMLPDYCFDLYCLK